MWRFTPPPAACPEAESTLFIALATVATRILLGRAVDRYGEARLVYTGNAAIVIGILLLVFAHNVPCYLLSALLLGYSFGAIQPSLQTMAMHAVAPERRGAASSTFSWLSTSVLRRAASWQAYW